ncbi:MAG TPA: hypothetical protein VEU31_08720 [Candidatus Acidoferrales bacterium]|nr:hypothetical protein [Candidatus Acidoferrales bacterium]
MAPSKKLLNFFRREFQMEERSGFARLKRVPDSHVTANLRYYSSLGEVDKIAFADCSAHWAHVCYGFVVGAPKCDHTQHPFFSKWKSSNPLRNHDWDAEMRSVPYLRAMVQTYKMDMHRGVSSYVTKEQFDYASSVRPVKAPELRKRVRAALNPLGYYKIDELGYYCCRQGKREFRVHIDYGGRHAQLRYVVSRSEFKGVHPLSQFGFERALGFGHGDWNFIVEENVDDVFSLFPELVTYSFDLPDRIRAEAA